MSDELDKKIYEGIKKIEDNQEVILKLFNDGQDEVVRLEKWIQRHEKMIKEFNRAYTAYVIETEQRLEALEK